MFVLWIHKSLHYDSFFFEEYQPNTNIAEFLAVKKASKLYKKENQVVFMVEYSLFIFDVAFAIPFSQDVFLNLT